MPKTSVRKRRLSDAERIQPKLGNPINNKLGPAIHTWSIPAGSTCPGKTPACAGCCYAMRGFFNMPNVDLRMHKNEQFSRSPEFVEWMRKSLWAHSVRVMRVHTAGDFYDAEYTNKWLTIAEQNPRTLFFGYTRSWRTPEIMTVLEQLALVNNFRLWFSADVHTGMPPHTPGLQGFAWLARDDFEANTAPGWADLVFRNEVTSVMKKANGVQVCPNEIGLPEPHQRLTCTQCQLCFRKKGPF